MRIDQLLKAAGLLAVVGLGLGAGLVYTRTAPAPQEAGAPALGGPWELTDFDGRRVNQDLLVGKPSALFFGFTQCPEICPVTVGNMEYWADQLGDLANDLQLVFVTVDPARDTPEVLSAFLRAQSDRIIGLTGTDEDIARIAEAWKVYYASRPLDGGDYTMDHSSMIYLVDDTGSFSGIISHGESDERALAALRDLLEG